MEKQTDINRNADLGEPIGIGGRAKQIGAINETGPGKPLDPAHMIGAIDPADPIKAIRAADTVETDDDVVIPDLTVKDKIFSKTNNLGITQDGKFPKTLFWGFGLAIGGAFLYLYLKKKGYIKMNFLKGKK